MEQLKIGIVGLGSFAAQHIQCLRQFADVRIQAVCDRLPEVSASIARELGCAGYTDYREMLRHEKLDVLDIVLPEALHYDVAMAGLRAGSHLFVEKPLDTDAARAAEIAREAARIDRQLMVGHVTRFDPRIMQIKQTIDSGALGRIRSIYCRRSDVQRGFATYRRTHPIFVLGIHDIDQILWCANEMPVEVYAKSASSGEGEDLVWATLTFPSGLIAVVESNWLAPDAWPAAQDQLMIVSGEQGVAKVQLPDHAVSVCTAAHYMQPKLFGLRDMYGRIEGPLMSELQHFIDCVRNRQASAILPPQAAVATVQVAEAVVRSCREGRPVRLPFGGGS
jgi:predicted dehydrogenase